MEFREKREEVSGGLTILFVLAISAIVWCISTSFISHKYCSDQNLQATKAAGISR
jgi:hypothetical protein